MAGIYIHIPFCKKACNYCDFYFSVNQKELPAFIDALIKELHLRKNELGGQRIDTIYFGGGTPSLLDEKYIDQVLKEIYATYKVSEDAEITLEANPDDLTKAQLLQFKHAGINRLSIGIQSFETEHLRWMNRAHDSTQAIDCLLDAKEVGFSNISADLIYGFNQLSDQQFLDNLNKLNRAGVQHLSCYSLTVEPKTLLAHHISIGKAEQINDEIAARHLELLMDWAAQNDFEHYEISNFCRSGHQSKHNSAYWSGKDYLGLGPSAHSFTEGQRKSNFKNTGVYIQYLKLDKLCYKTEHLSLLNQYNEYIITGLRTKVGIRENDVLDKFGKDLHQFFIKNIHKMIDSKLVVIENNQTFRLSRSGILVADFVMLTLIKV